MSGTHTHWGMVINNYDETDLALLAQAYPDHIRKLVYTREVGKEGTPHIQAFIKMKRDCRLSHMRKLFPKGHFNYLETSEYKLNAERYAQKQDETADGPSVIVNGDPLHTIEGIIRVVITEIISQYPDETDLDTARRWVEKEMVIKDYTMAKVFVSACYKSMWKDWGHEMYQNISHTHTHTHTQVVDVPTPRTYFLKEIREIGTQTDERDFQGQSDDEEEFEGGSEEDDDAGTGSVEGSGSEGSEVSDCSSIGE